MCTPHALKHGSLQIPEQAVGIARAGIIINGCELSDIIVGLNMQPVEEQQVLLTTEPILQPLVFAFKQDRFRIHCISILVTYLH